MRDVPDTTVEEFVSACHRAAAHDLMRCSSGNMSWRLDDDRFLVTASGSWMGSITPDQVSVCCTADGSLLEGQPASVETGFHAGILCTRADVDVVLHFQSPCATTLGCTADAATRNFAVIPEVPVYIGPIASVPYILPGSPELAVAVVQALQQHDLAVLSHHGQVTVARDLNAAIQNAAFFELACHILLHGGQDIEPLPEEAIAAFQAHRTYTAPA
ncbi:MAG: class II aldolase/adducin family protein [Verrucomicrobia bacterium]|nr:class II aldolase/adducin family protein [Verrucomicrobiota bacterium]MBT7064931.1 class II aldolase/adducin family protein [Verrucomicrobiota bacterium]MBT7699898.1 class II aldolase/adducin family protein [Verrucomicrobiota bacterium]